MIVDSHCHLDLLNLDDLHYQSLDEVLQFAETKNIKHCLCVNVTWEDFPKVLNIAEQYPNVSASVGVHPSEQEGHDPSIEELVKAAQHQKIVAMGETGLDYTRMEGSMVWQHERFGRHIEAAKQVRKPLIIHTRMASKDTIAIMKSHQAAEIGGVMHCFTEDWAMAKAALDLNFYISFSGIVTFKNAKTVQTVAKQVPLDRLLVETDSPYLAPVPYRGKTNQPGYTYHVAEFLAELRNESFETLCEQTTNNYQRLFGPLP